MFGKLLRNGVNYLGRISEKYGDNLQVAVFDSLNYLMRDPRKIAGEFFVKKSEFNKVESENLSLRNRNDLLLEDGDNLERRVDRLEEHVVKQINYMKWLKKGKRDAQIARMDAKRKLEDEAGLRREVEKQYLGAVRDSATKGFNLMTLTFGGPYVVVNSEGAVSSFSYKAGEILGVKIGKREYDVAQDVLFSVIKELEKKKGVLENLVVDVNEKKVELGEVRGVPINISGEYYGMVFDFKKIGNVEKVFRHVKDVGSVSKEKLVELLRNIQEGFNDLENKIKSERI